MKVILTGSNGDVGKAIQNELFKSGHTCYGLPKEKMDVTNYEEVQQVFAGLKYHTPDVLINNAGKVKLGSILELTPADWKHQIDVNLNGVFYCCKEFVRIANKKGSKIINIASTAGLGGRPGRSAYSASKAGVINFTESIASELRPYNIKVYCICLGACNTKLRHEIYPDDNFNNMLQPKKFAEVVLNIIEHGNYLDNQNILIRENF